jgi:hypothetical protein
MNILMKGAMIVSIAALGLSLSACGSESANANATATPDPAEQTAASIDAAGTTGAPQPAAEQPAK